jgi:hypothetical protein
MNEENGLRVLAILIGIIVVGWLAGFLTGLLASRMIFP